MLVAAFLQDVACDMLADPAFSVPAKHSQPTIKSEWMPPHSVADIQGDAGVDVEQLKSQMTEELAELSRLQASWPEKARSWPADPNDKHPAGYILPGTFNSPYELGILPRQTVLDGWNPSLDHSVPPFHPICLSTRTTDPAYNLTPIATEGWSHWVHEKFQDKPYLVARKPGSWAKFELETGLGIIKVYALKSKTFGLGNVRCWVGEDEDQSVEVEGWWDNGDA